MDTLVVLSNQTYSLKNLEELSNIFSPIKYTFGMNFNNNEHLSKLILFSNYQKIIDLESHTVESTLSSLNKLYSNVNKNILDANFLELYNSYESRENLFTLFSDGILLYKNLQDSYYFNVFPQNKFMWNEELGKFNNISESIPYSYYGFSFWTYAGIKKYKFKNFSIPQNLIEKLDNSKKNRIIFLSTLVLSALIIRLYVFPFDVPFFKVSYSTLSFNPPSFL